MSKKKVENVEIPNLLGEVWKDIINYEGWYQVSNKKRIKSLQRTIVYSSGSVRLQNSKLLKTRISNGYLGVTLRKMNKTRTTSLHRLIAEAFIPNPENKPQVNHIDGNKLNNCIENLEWATASENTIHAIQNGLLGIKYGEQTSGAKLTEKEVLEIRAIGRSLKQKEIAEKYGVTTSAISGILLRKNWNHI